ncbi:MAG: hypothetical protein HOI45_10045 [Rhodospirillaceae bacterium]|jgi:hypothetical protein|nr:hypothetical protein [Rhodospirillaceae bacterium]
MTTDTYGAILKGHFPSLVLVPSGGKEAIRSFAQIHEKILKKTIWGVEFFMLCDRDAIPLSPASQTPEGPSGARLKTLSKYHLENYFLDSTIWAQVFSHMEEEDSWLSKPDEIEKVLKGIATESISYATSLQLSAQIRNDVGNIDVMPKDCFNKSIDDLLSSIDEKFEEENKRVKNSLDKDVIMKMTTDIYNILSHSLSSGDEWKDNIPGRTILGKFASKTNMDVGRLKVMYIKEAEKLTPSPFQEIIDIFESFELYGI